MAANRYKIVFGPTGEPLRLEDFIGPQGPEGPQGIPGTDGLAALRAAVATLPDTGATVDQIVAALKEI